MSEGPRIDNKLHEELTTEEIREVYDEAEEEELPDPYVLRSIAQVQYCPECGRETEHESGEFEYQVSCPEHGQIILG